MYGAGHLVGVAVYLLIATVTFCIL